MDPAEPDDSPEIDFVIVLVNPPNVDPNECPMLKMVGNENRKLSNENNWNLSKIIFHTNLWPWPWPLDSGLIKWADFMMLLPALETESPADAIN